MLIRTEERRGERRSYRRNTPLFIGETRVANLQSTLEFQYFYSILQMNFREPRQEREERPFSAGTSCAWAGLWPVVTRTLSTYHVGNSNSMAQCCKQGRSIFAPLKSRTTLLSVLLCSIKRYLSHMHPCIYLRYLHACLYRIISQR